MKRPRAEESAGGLALMTSSVMSSYSADDLREQSQESADSLYIQTQERSDVVEEAIQSQATIQQMLFALINQSQDTSWKHMFNTSWTTRRKQQQHPVVKYNESTVATHPVVGKSSRRKSRLSHTVEAGVHLWSLGVLTAADCGIGSVHEVVRSNLLVEPSEVEEGEM
ncbi:hypothetical protein F511_25622 [Dorcoceras hygrometricum]|uniref:Uncharacterized protein n=1 Tax=Dorcoceras hygrometricum TaxID=472368 RepID=A0A2Z7CUI6_9LAMI|nr:hypothetical protein F511_25622 [Dorcoceras hygrometricum]